MQLCKRFFLIYAIISALGTNSNGQDLRRDKAFFNKKLPEFREWITENKLDGIFYADSIAVTANKATLFIRPAFSGAHVCDSMQCAWNKLEAGNRNYNGQFFHERLLRKWAFLAEVPEEKAEVIVRCHDPAHFYSRIYSKNGKTPVEGRSLRAATMLQMSLPTGAIRSANTGGNTATITNAKVVPVCTKAKGFFINWYKGKGTPVLYQAQIDTSMSFEDEFTVEVTKLSNEICPDGFFEYHQIHFTGVQKGDDVEITWEFQGKYGSGILFPPRKNGYKDLELRYKTELETYQRNLFKRLINHLGKK